MKFLQIINEMWVASRKNPFGKYAEIFKNPTLKELKSLGNFPRIIADSKTKTLFAFHNYLLHSWAAEELKIKRSKTEFDSRYLEGQVSFKDNKIYLEEINFFESFKPNEVKSKKYKKYIKDLVDHDWSWLKNKYNIEYELYFKKRVKKFI